jgi:EPS-associated MarR family transcriptional regulator
VYGCGRLAIAPDSRLNSVCSTVERSPNVLTDEYRYKILRLLEADPQMSQRDLARELGISLGKTNYCLRALMETGLIKANNFKNNRNKKAYMYFLTPRGISEKARATANFLERKVAEYEALQREIEHLRREVNR